MKNNAENTTKGNLHLVVDNNVEKILSSAFFEVAEGIATEVLNFSIVNILKNHLIEKFENVLPHLSAREVNDFINCQFNKFCLDELEDELYIEYLREALVTFEKFQGQAKHLAENFPELFGDEDFEDLDEEDDEDFYEDFEEEEDFYDDEDDPAVGESVPKGPNGPQSCPQF